MIDSTRFASLVLTAERTSRRGRKWSRIFLRDAIAAMAARDRLQSDEPLKDFAMKYDDALSAAVSSNGRGACEECGRVSSHSDACSVGRRMSVELSERALARREAVAAKRAELS